MAVAAVTVCPPIGRLERRVLDDLGARQARLEAEARRLEVARDRLQEGSSSVRGQWWQGHDDPVLEIVGPDPYR